jgi:hypothetical protein
MTHWLYDDKQGFRGSTVCSFLATVNGRQLADVNVEAVAIEEDLGGLGTALETGLARNASLRHVAESMISGAV